jgi:hypothetical protein
MDANISSNSNISNNKEALSSSNSSSNSSSPLNNSRICHHLPRLYLQAPRPMLNSNPLQQQQGNLSRLLQQQQHKQHQQ